MSGSTASAAYSGPPTINGITEVDADVLVISDGGTISYPDYPDTVLVVQTDGTVVGVSEIADTQVPTTLRATTFPSLVVVGAISANSVTLGDDLTVGDDALVQGDLTVVGTASIGTVSTVNLALSGTLSVAGATTLAAMTCSSMTCSGASTFNGFMTVNNDILVTGTIGGNCNGAFLSLYADDLAVGVTANLAATTVSNFTATGSTFSVAGAATMAAITCTTLAASGAVTVGSTLGVTGASTLAALTCTTLAASGDVTVGGTLGVTGATTLATPVGINMAPNAGRALGVTSTSSNTSIHAVASSSGTAYSSVGRAIFAANGVTNSYFASSALNAFYSSTVGWGLNTDSFDLGIKLGNNSSSTGANQFTQIRMEQRAGGLLDRPILDLQAVRTTAATGEVALAVTGRDTGMVSYTMRTSMMTGNQYCFFSPNTSTGWVSMLSQIAPTTGYKFGVGPSGSTATHSELNGNVLVRGTASFNSTLSVLGASTMAAVSATTLTASDRFFSNYAAASQMVFTPGTAASTFIRVEGPAGGVNRRISFIDPGAADRQVLYTDMAQAATLGALTIDDGAATPQLQIPGDGTASATQELWFGQDAAGETQWRLLGANSTFGSNWRVRSRLGGVSSDRIIVAASGTSIWSNLGVGKAPTANALDVLGDTVLQALTCTTLACTTLSASSNATVGGTLSVTGASTLAAVTCTTLTTSGNVTVGGTLSVAGAITFAVVSCSSLAVSGAVTIGTTLSVTGASTLTALTCTTLTCTGSTSLGSTLADRVELDASVRQMLTEDTASSALPRTFCNINWARNMNTGWGSDSYIVCVVPIKSYLFVGNLDVTYITHTGGDMPSVGDVLRSTSLLGSTVTVTSIVGSQINFSGFFQVPAAGITFSNDTQQPWDDWRRIGAMLRLTLTMREYNTTRHGIYRANVSMNYLTANTLSAEAQQDSDDFGMPGVFNGAFNSFRIYQPSTLPTAFWIVFTHGLSLPGDYGCLVDANLIAPGRTTQDPYWIKTNSLVGTSTTVVTSY
jgi:hypothetical protein